MATSFLSKIKNFLIKRRNQPLIFFIVIGLCWGLSVFFLEKHLSISGLEYRLILADIGSKNFSNEKITENKKIATIIFIGDIMLDRGVEYAVKKYGKGDYSFPFLKIADFLKERDVIFGNLESIISDRGQKVGSIYSFRAEPQAIDGLIFAGFNILSVANNHIFDYTRAAMEDSLSRLKTAGIDYVGAGFSENEVRNGIIKEINGFKIGFLAYTNLGSKNWKADSNSSGIAWLNEKMEEDIKIMKEKADFVVVSMHFGDEYKRQSNAEQEYFSHLAIDSGADLVIGHHPHVVQGLEKYNGKMIFYSLGNFVFDQYFSRETQEGLTIRMEIYPERLKYCLIPVKINSGQAILMEEKEKIGFLDELARMSDESLSEGIKSSLIQLTR